MLSSSLPSRLTHHLPPPSLPYKKKISTARPGRSLCPGKPSLRPLDGDRDPRFGQRRPLPGRRPGLAERRRGVSGRRGAPGGAVSVCSQEPRVRGVADRCRAPDEAENKQRGSFRGGEALRLLGSCDGDGARLGARPGGQRGRSAGEGRAVQARAGDGGQARKGEEGRRRADVAAAEPGSRADAGRCRKRRC